MTELAAAADQFNMICLHLGLLATFSAGKQCPYTTLAVTQHVISIGVRYCSGIFSCHKCMLA